MLCYNVIDARILAGVHLRKEWSMIDRTKEILQMLAKLTISEKAALYEQLLILMQSRASADNQNPQDPTSTEQ